MKTVQLFDRRQIFTNMGALLSGTAIARVISALALILLARQVGPTAFGQFAASLALTKVSSVLFKLGLDGWLLRNGNRSGERRILAQLGASTLAITFGLGLIWLLAVALLAGFLNQSVFPYSVVLLSALFVWLEGMLGAVWTTFKAGLQNKTTFVLITSAQTLLLLITILLMAMGGRTLEPFLWGRGGA
jgi:O-antigen/teichoic acid export membrane protein